jgi:nucleotide-binding universal stress UspA family protein
VARAAPDSYRDQLWRELERMKQRDITVGMEPMLEDGHPAKQIVQTAKDEGCSLILMGTHGRTGLSRLLMGSVAEHVLRHATCPVLTVKMPLSKQAPEESAPTREKAKV